MSYQKHWLLSAIIGFSFLLPGVSVAGGSQEFGEYVVHFNALPTDSLSPDVARQYNIKRSKNRALLNIAVQKKSGDALNQPVTASIKAHANNLNGQLKHFSPREIKEGKAIYYITDFSVANQEKLNFNIEFQPEGSGKTYQLTFSQQFFTD